MSGRVEGWNGRSEMNSMNIEGVKAKASEFYWYHCIDLGDGFVTDGDYDLNAFIPYYGFPDLSGKRVLDVGAASGFFSFYFEKQGAEVIATELPSIREWDFVGGRETIEQLNDFPGMEFNRLKNSFDFAHAFLHSRVKKVEINVYDISPETVGLHDIVFMGSLLSHLRDPIRALERLFSVTEKMLIVAAPICNLLPDHPVMFFVGKEYQDVRSWWLPNRKCLIQMIESVGFKNVEEKSAFTMVNRRVKGLTVLHSVVHAHKI
jgi:tRNA (mo5U34)-methyltransferase